MFQKLAILRAFVIMEDRSEECCREYFSLSNEPSHITNGCFVQKLHSIEISAFVERALKSPKRSQLCLLQ